MSPLRHLTPGYIYAYDPIACCQCDVKFSGFRPPSSSCRIAEGITELKDIVVKKFEDKPDNPRLGFCDFLKVEVVQLTSNSYDKFQQETFNLLMRLKCRDKQQQRYQHGTGTSMAQTVTYSQALTSHHYPVSHTQMQAPHHQMQQTFKHIPQGLAQQHLQQSQQHFQQTFTQPHAPAQQQIHGHCPQQGIQPQQHAP